MSTTHGASAWWLGPSLVVPLAQVIIIMSATVEAKATIGRQDQYSWCVKHCNHNHQPVCHPLWPPTTNHSKVVTF